MRIRALKAACWACTADAMARTAETKILAAEILEKLI